VWTGRQAKERGLVDELGGLDRAIAIAKERAKIAAERDVELVVYPPRRSVYELLSDRLSGAGDELAIGAWMSTHLNGDEIQALRILRGPLAIFHRGEPLALMPPMFVR
jgi:protease-4